jgi:hypothetical protein
VRPGQTLLRIVEMLPSVLAQIEGEVDNSSATWRDAALFGSNELGHTRVNRALIRAPGNHFRGAEFDDKVLSLCLKRFRTIAEPRQYERTRESRCSLTLCWWKQALQAHAEHASYARIASITCTAFFFLGGVCSEASLATKTLPRDVALRWH